MRPVCFFLLICISSFQPVAYAAEPRRCDVNGKIIITDIPCSALGGVDTNPRSRAADTPKHESPPPKPVTKISPPQIPSSPPPAPLISNSTAQPTVSFNRAFLEAMTKPPMGYIWLILAAAILAKIFSEKTKGAPKRNSANVGFPSLDEPTLSTTNEPSWHKWGTPPHSTTLSSDQDDPAESILRTKPTDWSLDLIQDLEWKRFEDVCQQFYEKKGIRSETTPLGPDGGIDIRLYQDDSNHPTSIVQCKAWGNRIVGVGPVRELLGVMTHEKISQAFFMTSGSYSDDAKKFAQANRITLIDGVMLLMMIQRMPSDERESLLAFAIDGDYITPTCPTCGIKMRKRKSKGGRTDFWGCQNYPRCRQKLGMRHSHASLVLSC